MTSNDDNLYASTVRQTPKSWWGWKLLAPNHKQAPKPRQDLRRQATKRNVWALKGPEELH